MPAVGQRRGEGPSTAPDPSLLPEVCFWKPLSATKNTQNAEANCSCILYTSHLLNRKSQHWPSNGQLKLSCFPFLFPVVQTEGWGFPLVVEKTASSSSLYLHVLMFDTHFHFLPSKHCSLQKKGNRWWCFQSHDCGDCRLFHDSLRCRYRTQVWCLLQSVTTGWQCVTRETAPDRLRWRVLGLFRFFHYVSSIYLFIYLLSLCVTHGSWAKQVADELYTTG